MSPDREEKIRQRAYELWEAEGRPEGRQAEHWQRAAREIEAEEGGAAGMDATEKADPTDEAAETSGLSSSLQPGGTIPAANPETTEGSIGTGGGSTTKRSTGTARRVNKK